MLNAKRAWTVAVLALLSSGVWGQVGIEDQPDRIVLHNERVTLALSKPDKGAVVSLMDNATGRDFAAKQAEPCLFRLVFTKKGDVSGATETLSSGDAGQVAFSRQSTADGETALLHFSAIGGRKIEARCSVFVRKGDPPARWRISVSGSEPLVLEEVQFPIIVMKDTLGESIDDDAALVGATEDGVRPKPGQWPVGGWRRYTQPGPLCAQFCCYYDAESGCFSATQDGKGYPKRLAMGRMADGIHLTWAHLCYHELGKPFELDYDVVCTTFRSSDKAIPTDWRDAADIHKEWALNQPWCARTVAQRQDIPDWLKRGCVRLQWELRNDGPPDAVATWLDRYWQKHFAPLPPLVTIIGFEHVADWIAPKYFPCYPSDAAFGDVTRKIREMGGHVFLFPSSYQWCLTYDKRADGSFEWDDRADFEKIGRPHAILNRDGSVFTKAYSWLRGGENAALCRGDTWSREFLNDTLLQLVKRGVDVIQMDQVVGGHWPANPDTVCYGRDHGHPPGPGLWDVEAFHEQMKSLRRRCDEVRPGVVFSEESPQELFAQDFGLFDYRHDRANVNVKVWDLAPRRHAPVFPYLYHEFVPVFQIPSHTEPVAVILAHAIVSGEIPSFKARQVEFPGAPVIENGGLEEWGDGPAGWRIWRSHPDGPGSISQDEKEKRAGRSSLRLDGAQEDETVQIYQCIPVDGTALSVGKACRLGLSLRSEGLAGKAVVCVEARDNMEWQVWKLLDSWTIEAPGKTDWKEVSTTFTLPQGTRNLRLVLSLTGKGKVWFDDLKLGAVGADGAVNEVMRQGNAVLKMARQWVQLVSEGAGKYLLLGRMLHPPPLQTGKLQHTISANKSTSLTMSLYTLKSDGAGTGEYASCPLTVPRGEGTWEQKSLEITIRPGAGELHVPLSLRQKGELFFDDFVLTEVGSDKNLLANGGFEDWQDASAPPPGWAHIKEYQGRTFTGKFYRDDKEKHGGKCAIRMVNETSGDVVHLKQVLPVDGKLLSIGKTYRLTFWAKVSNVPRWQPISVVREFPVILHKAFRAPDGGEAVVLINITDQPQTGRMTWRGAETELSLSPWEIRLIRSDKAGSRREEP